MEEEKYLFTKDEIILKETKSFTKSNAFVFPVIGGGEISIFLETNVESALQIFPLLPH